MPFIRKKKLGNFTYKYLVENQRVDGKVKQKVVLYLGHADTVEGSLRGFEEKAGWARQMITNLRYRKATQAGWDLSETNILNYDRAVRKLASIEKKIEALKGYLASVATG